MSNVLPEMKIHVTNDDIKYLLFEQPDIISDYIRANGVWNLPVFEKLLRILNKFPNGTFLDIGAGLGSVTIPLAVLFNNTLKFHSFEPLRIIFMQLASNVLINNLNNVNIENVALSNSNQRLLADTIDIFTNGNHGAFSFNEEANKHRGIIPAKEKSLFEFKTLDSYNFINVRFIKLSAPGMELEVLEGAQNTILQNDCPPILLEGWLEPWYSERLEKTKDYLKNKFKYIHYEDIDGYTFIFKSIAERDFLFADVKTVKEGNFMVSEKMHDTDLTLKDQVMFTGS